MTVHWEWDVCAAEGSQEPTKNLLHDRRDQMTKTITQIEKKKHTAQYVVGTRCCGVCVYVCANQPHKQRQRSRSNERNKR